MSELALRWGEFETLNAECESLIEHANANELLSNGVREIIYETVLMRAFRGLENLLEETFLEYVLGEPALDGTKVNAYVRPRDRTHARNIVKPESSRFLDWAEPSQVRARCGLYFHEDDPIFLALSTRGVSIDQSRRLRNHVAHNSIESSAQYRKVLKDVLVTEPIETPRAGEFLRMVPARGKCRGLEILDFYLSEMSAVARAAVRA